MPRLECRSGSAETHDHCCFLVSSTVVGVPPSPTLLELFPALCERASRNPNPWTNHACICRVFGESKPMVRSAAQARDPTTLAWDSGSTLAQSAAFQTLPPGTMCRAATLSIMIITLTEIITIMMITTIAVSFGFLTLGQGHPSRCLTCSILRVHPEHHHDMIGSCTTAPKRYAWFLTARKSDKYWKKKKKENDRRLPQKAAQESLVVLAASFTSSNYGRHRRQHQQQQHCKQDAGRCHDSQNTSGPCPQAILSVVLPLLATLQSHSGIVGNCIGPE